MLDRNRINRAEQQGVASKMLRKRKISQCRNCDGFVIEQYVRMFAPTGMDTVRVYPNCEDKHRDRADVREAKSPRHTTHG